MIATFLTLLRALVSILRTLVSLIVEILWPDTTLVRNRYALSLELVKALFITLLAVVLTVGYQVLRLWARRAEDGD